MQRKLFVFFLRLAKMWRLRKRMTYLINFYSPVHQQIWPLLPSRCFAFKQFFLFSFRTIIFLQVAFYMRLPNLLIALPFKVRSVDLSSFCQLTRALSICSSSRLVFFLLPFINLCAWIDLTLKNTSGFLACLKQY